jgi:hypothetical protein
VIHEVSLYRDLDTTSPTISSSHLWSLLTAARDFLIFALSIPREALTDLPASFFSGLPYSMIVLSAVTRLPTMPGWDSTIAKREADVVNYMQQVKRRFGDELSKTRPDLPVDQKDVWQCFSRGLTGVLSWHHTFDSSGPVEGDMEIPITSSSTTMQCSVAETMNALSAMLVRKPIPLNYGPAASDPASAAAVTNANVVPGSETQQTDLGLWDDAAWQAIIDDFSMFPTTAGLPLGSTVQF